MQRDQDKVDQNTVLDSPAYESREALHDFIAQELRSINTAYQGTAAAPAKLYGGYHQAAAVLSTFEINKIKPVVAEGVEVRIEDLLADSTSVYDEMPTAPESQAKTDVGSQSPSPTIAAAPVTHWALLPDIRRNVIEQMRTREAFVQALEANPERGAGVMQKMLDAYLLNQAPPISSQSVEELACSAQVVEWFQGMLEQLPDHQTISRRLDFKRLIQPFEKLVGENFSGREDQLKQLREYVGVLAPTSLIGQLRRSAEKFFNLRLKPPLMIYGPGGVGKSTLVAKFILDHALLGVSQRFPFAYLDFDRPGLLAEEPATLLIEAVRQLGIQYPDVQEHSERVRKDWQDELALAARQSRTLNSSTKLSKQQRTDFLRDFDALLSAMGLSDESFLLVLDTFEEVQYRSQQYISQLWEFLDELQSIIPRLRTVFSGRIPLAGFKTEEVPLRELDAGAAKGFLKSAKIEPESLIDTIVKQVGGNPLSLRLAVQIFHTDKARGASSKEFFSRLHKGRIQTELYSRVLEHIHDRDIQKLAHPGLILRRITPGLILKVLAKPCGVAVNTLKDAEKLFNRLRQEVTLVAPGGATKTEPQALRHMPEVRKGMIQLLRDDAEQKAKILAIQENAISYYELIDDPICRAEEIYHRLALKQDRATIAERWLTGVNDQLFNAIEELEPVQQGFLAGRLGVDVDDSVLAQALPDDWEAIVKRRAEAMLGLRQFQQLLVLLGQRTDRLPGSPLYLLEAQAYHQQGQSQEARKIIEQGLDSKPPDTLTFDLLMLAARIDAVDLHNNESAHQYWDKARRVAKALHDDIRLVEVMLESSSTPPPAELSTLPLPEAVEELKALARTISATQWAEHLDVFRKLVARFGSEDIDLLTRAVDLLGFESAGPGLLRRLGRAFAKWDLRVSTEANLDPGMLARIARVPVQGDLSDVWKIFMQTAPPKQVKDVVSLLLSRYSMDGVVRNALFDIFSYGNDDDPNKSSPVGGGAPVTPVAAGESTGTPSIPSLTLTPEEKQRLTFALKSAFPTRSSLADMLWFRLNLNLDSISLTDTLELTASSLVDYADSRGILVQLLSAAYDSNRGNLHLANFVRRMGLTADSNIDPELLDKIIQDDSVLGVDQWRTTFAGLTGRICRVEVTGSDLSYGTGFLVGPNVLMTSYQLLEPVISGPLATRAVAFRFDFKVFSEVPLNSGIVYRLAADDWLVASSPRDSLNVVVVRLAEVPGREPIGGDKAEPEAPPRGWIHLPSTQDLAPLTKRLLVLSFQSGDSVRLLLNDEKTGIKFNENASRMAYKFAGVVGSTGAPCFNTNLQLIGLHGGSESGQSYGVPLSAIVEQVLGIRSAVETDKFDTTVLRGGRVFLNRALLRTALREMASPSGRRILIVNGPHGSGKTYTREYVYDVTFNTPNHRAVYLDLDTQNFSPVDIAQAISSQIGYDVATMPTLTTSTIGRYIRTLCDWLMAGISRSTSIKWWFIFDGFEKELVPESRDMIEELSLRTSRYDFRMILLNYTFNLSASLASQVLREDISPIGADDVAHFISEQFNRYNRELTPEALQSMVERVMEATGQSGVASGGEASGFYPSPNRLRILNREISKLIREYGDADKYLA